MSGLVGNPKDRISSDAANLAGQFYEQTCLFAPCAFNNITDQSAPSPLIIHTLNMDGVYKTFIDNKFIFPLRLQILFIKQK